MHSNLTWRVDLALTSHIWVTIDESSGLTHPAGGIWIRRVTTPCNDPPAIAGSMIRQVSDAWTVYPLGFIRLTA